MTAALRLPRILVVALSVIVGGEIIVFTSALLRGGSPPGEHPSDSSHPGKKRHARSSCGPIALKMIFDHFRIPCTFEEIEKRIEITPKGTSLSSLKEMAEAKGLSANGWKLTFDDLRSFRSPVIAYVNGNHFLVVDSVAAGGTVCLRDARGTFTWTGKEFARRWHGETLVFGK